MNMAQTSLFDVKPPMDGVTFDPKQDGARLHRQLAAVKARMSDGKWHTLKELAEDVGASEASISARIRDLRKVKFGGYTVERQRLKDGSGQHFYRLVTP
jgi:biotin operon repressor